MFRPLTGDNALGSPPNYRLRAPTARKRTNREPATVGPTSNQKRQADRELNKTRFHRQVWPTCCSDVWFWASNTFWAPGVPRDWVGACGSPHLTKGIQIQTLRSILLEPASVASRGGRFGQVATFVVWFRPEGPGESRKIRGGQAVPLRQGGSLSNFAVAISAAAGVAACRVRAVPCRIRRLPAIACRGAPPRCLCNCREGDLGPGKLLFDLQRPRRPKTSTQSATIAGPIGWDPTFWGPLLSPTVVVSWALALPSLPFDSVRTALKYVWRFVCVHVCSPSVGRLAQRLSRKASYQIRCPKLAPFVWSAQTGSAELFRPGV